MFQIDVLPVIYTLTRPFPSDSHVKGALMQQYLFSLTGTCHINTDCTSPLPLSVEATGCKPSRVATRGSTSASKAAAAIAIAAATSITAAPKPVRKKTPAPSAADIAAAAVSVSDKLRSTRLAVRDANNQAKTASTPAPCISATEAAQGIPPGVPDHASEPATAHPQATKSAQSGARSRISAGPGKVVTQPPAGVSGPPVTSEQALSEKTRLCMSSRIPSLEAAPLADDARQIPDTSAPRAAGSAVTGKRQASPRNGERHLEQGHSTCRG